jgi:hypothetical protein
MRKNEMLIVVPGERSGKRRPNSSATRATSLPLRITEHSPVPWTPRTRRRSSL